MEVQTIYRDVVIGTRHLFNPEGKSTHGQGTSMLYAGIALAVVALVTFVATAIDVGKEKAAYEAWQTAGKESKNFPWEARTPGPDVVVVFGGARRPGAVLHGPQAARQDQPELHHRLRRRRRRAGLARLRARRRRTRWWRRPAPTTSSTSRRG